MKAKRRWLGLQVWIAEENGHKHKGTLWWVDETRVLIRKNGRTGLVALPKSAEGSRWGVVEDGMSSDGRN
jgi:hypothetical protein